MLEHEPPVEQRSGRTSLRHWQASYELLIRPLDERTSVLLGIDAKGARRQLYAAVAGHHGRPPSGKKERFDDEDGVADALLFIDDLSTLVPGDDVWTFDKAQAARFSWTVAGLTVLADWIGSNTDWFPFVAHDIPVANYWEEARCRAVKAVGEASVGGSRIARSVTLQSLFGINSPRPMQTAVAELDVSNQPTMVVIEDATGSGKTESAVLLAQRMMASGLGEGVYVALPTMATANAMFGRLSNTYRALFDAESRPSLALAHGARDLDKRFVEAVAAGLREEEESTTRVLCEVEDIEVSAFCASWIADDRRKTFNAEVGIGTIDQAFLSVLPVKFAVLRLVGLARRVLIIDEAHACDPYMEVELCRLLEMQATLGGSAIVMTATLTQSLRERLVNAYRSGLGSSAGSIEMTAHYPSLTVARASVEDCLDLAIEPCSATVRNLPVKRVSSIDNAMALMVKAARDGAAVAWVRNTVDDVIDGHDRLVIALADEHDCEVELFHARFAMGDRLDVESGVLERFGRNAHPAMRRGRIIVASQVIEASLDLDFDVMVSDLAPIDSLIQRAGRLWRHLDLRPPDTRATVGPILHVLSPDPNIVENASWGREQFGGSGFIYGTSVLWRSARALFDAGSIDAPDGLRSLLEAVVGEGRPDVPAPLEHDENSLLGEEYADAARSRANAVLPAKGYFESAIQGTDASFPTRADTDSCRVVLVRWSGDELVTWVEDDPTAALSEIGLRRYIYEKLVEGGGAPKASIVPGFAASWPVWRRDALRMLVVNPDGDVGDVARYDRVSGLRSVPDG